MSYARIDLSKTNYQTNLYFELVKFPNINELQGIYQSYCRYKKFKSVMPIFMSEFTHKDNDVLIYKVNGKTVAFSLLRRYDTANVEAIQFAWDYADPSLRLGIESLKNECAYYKNLGYKYLYLGEADGYKSEIDGFEILGPAK